MSKLKTAITSSVITFFILTFVYMYYFSKSTSDYESAEIFPPEKNIPSVTTAAFQENEDANNSITNSRRTIITETVKIVSPSVVGINVKEMRHYEYRSPFADHPFWKQFFGSQVYDQEVTGLGSGAIISPDGYILTNDHVAGSADEITITLSDGREYKAEKIGTDLTTDICLLKIDEHNLPFIEFGNSDDILIGEWVIALGNPFGLFNISDKPTVTVGVVSATGMNLNPVNNRYYLNMIQTDASINQGNSGGPLVNSLGQLIGMNALIWTAQGSSGNVGVGFAIPANKLQKVIAELKENGIFDRDFWTGLRIHSIDEGIANYYNLPNTRGVIITEVISNSPAEKADLEPGDIILKVEGFRIDNYETLKGVLQNYKTGERVSFLVKRNDEKINKIMTLERTQ